MLLTLLSLNLFLLFLVLYLLSKAKASQKHRADLETQLTDKQEIISVAAHEIGSPLTNIKGTLSIIAKEPNLSDLSHKFIARALISVEELISLIDGLLTISRFERGKIQIVKNETDFADLCQEVVSELRPTAAKENIALEYRAPKEPLPLVFLDSSRIKEVLGNLIGNAIKYASQGSVLLTLKNAGDHLLVSVSDNGPGITPGDLKLLFKRFVRLPGTRDGRGGVGLGLYISRLIVEAHNGKIWAESPSTSSGQAAGQGTTFYFTLPL